uniref:V-type proton ATPase subunit F n=1 Tax=Chromera velia CCMP2878 TaxID=1169474 RepID=A0A0G4FJ77_9ALVE|mmetsp:Transcript_52453/g.102649  ORF Transcript_52453/g.102649 Transcript_52453/m.102649 type:complete len:128 (+) Transcript_52453:268-651(+)|eukprot:Cvel_17260.t1-p1 / transcript=Cvel_17260.t1 / gene=Cvel_17260 / organism=Chromera_velia_CCMP2878 / gene_product=V-type proton ATPase subunit F, putative / transcript_product=V-type proton ATPase subunit F, putative / location=Cvel_scaffold1367:44572-47139(+) / protein_length=127 / sequence_SO=supercontig / SO=protein_coding / is_pseudo=false
MAPKKRFVGGHDLKVAIIGDEDTVTGFMLAGIGQRDGQGRTNFFVCDAKTRRVDIEEAWKNFIERRDIGMIMISQYIADEIRHLVDLHDAVIPTILEIPSKDKPFDPAKDSTLQRVKVFFGGNLDGF